MIDFYLYCFLILIASNNIRAVAQLFIIALPNGLA